MMKLFILAVFLQSGLADLQSFFDHGLVPEVISTSPKNLLNVTFPGSVKVLEGNLLRVSQVSEIPVVKWNAHPETLYTLIYFDPESLAPGSYLHWLVGNINGSDVAAGETILSFVPSGPPIGTGLHRYVFLLYKQREHTVFEEIPDDLEGRRGFYADDFTEKYKLGAAVAGNFFLTEYEDV